MKFSCEKALLLEAVTNVSRAVSQKSVVASLEGMLLSAQGGTLSLTGYDLELGITTSIEASVIREGQIVLSAKLFGEMVRKLPGERVEIDCDEKLLAVVRSGVTEYTILGLPAADYPELPSMSDCEQLELPGASLRSMINQTLFAISTNDVKPVHTGSLFDVQEGSVCVVSVDGFRLAVRREPISTGRNMQFIVPGKALSEIAKLLSDDEAGTQLLIGRKHIMFTIGSYRLIARLLEGDFLDYNAAIPKGGTTQVTIATRQFIDGIERASLLISDRLKSPLRVKFEEGLISLSCSTALGKAYDEVRCALSGPGVEMGFNNRYLLDALRAAECDEVRLEIGGPLSPIKILPREGDSFLFLVLPVRLKAE